MQSFFDCDGQPIAVSVFGVEVNSLQVPGYSAANYADAAFIAVTPVFFYFGGREQSRGEWAPFLASRTFRAVTLERHNGKPGGEVGKGVILRRFHPGPL